MRPKTVDGRSELDRVNPRRHPVDRPTSTPPLARLKIEGVLMNNRGSHPRGAVRQEGSTVGARTHRVNKVRGGYLVISLILVALYPLLPNAGRNAVFLLASFGAVAAVLAALELDQPAAIGASGCFCSPRLLSPTSPTSCHCLPAALPSPSMVPSMPWVTSFFWRRRWCSCCNGDGTTWAASSIRPSARWHWPGCSGTSYSARICCLTTKQVRPS